MDRFCHWLFQIFYSCFFVLALFFAVFLTTSASLAAEEDAAAKDHVDAGRGIAVSICGECHAVLPAGDSPFEPAPPFRNIVKQWPVESLAEALAEGIVVGHKAMPEFQFGPEALTDMLAYFTWLKKETAEP